MITAKEARDIAALQSNAVREAAEASPLYKGIGEIIKKEAMLGKLNTTIHLEKEDIEVLGHLDLVMNELLTLLRLKGYKACGWSSNYSFEVSWSGQGW